MFVIFYAYSHWIHYIYPITNIHPKIHKHSVLLHARHVLHFTIKYFETKNIDLISSVDDLSQLLIITDFNQSSHPNFQENKIYNQKSEQTCLNTKSLNVSLWSSPSLCVYYVP